MHTTRRIFRVDRHRIAFLKFILEGYEGLAFLRTVDAHRGVVEVAAAPGCEGEVARILEDLGRDMRIEPWPAA